MFSSYSQLRCLKFFSYFVEFNTFKLKQIFKNLIFLICLLSCSAAYAYAYAQSGNAMSLCGVSNCILSSSSHIAKLITACSYVLGLGIIVVAILKFKQHKDNPTQTTIGMPISYILIGSALLFLPSCLIMAGLTIFGAAAKTAGSLGPGVCSVHQLIISSPHKLLLSTFNGTRV